jgi:hypothetical protein
LFEIEWAVEAARLEPLCRQRRIREEFAEAVGILDKRPLQDILDDVAAMSWVVALTLQPLPVWTRRHRQIWFRRV